MGGAAGRPGATLARTASYPVPVSSRAQRLQKRATAQAPRTRSGLTPRSPSRQHGSAGLAHNRAPKLLNRQPKATVCPGPTLATGGPREQSKCQVFWTQPSQPNDPEKSPTTLACLRARGSGPPGRKGHLGTAGKGSFGAPTPGTAGPPRGAVRSAPPRTPPGLPQRAPARQQLVLQTKGQAAASGKGLW